MSERIEDVAIDRAARALTDGEPDGRFRAKVIDRIAERTSDRRFGRVFDPLLLASAVGVLVVLAVPAVLRIGDRPMLAPSVRIPPGAPLPAAAGPVAPPAEGPAGTQALASPRASTQPVAAAHRTISDDGSALMPYELPEGFTSLAIAPIDTMELAIDAMPAPDAITLGDMAIEPLTLAPLEAY